MATKKTATKAKSATVKAKKTVKKKTTTKAKKAAPAKKAIKVVKKTTSKTSAKATQPSRVKGTIKRSLKLKSIEKEIAIYFYAPLAQSVQIAGSFNSWNAGELCKDEQGTWQMTLNLKPGRYEYKYLVDGRWENAQNEHETVDNGQGSLNSVLTVS